MDSLELAFAVDEVLTALVVVATKLDEVFTIAVEVALIAVLVELEQ